MLMALSIFNDSDVSRIIFDTRMINQADHEFDDLACTLPNDRVGCEPISFPNYVQFYCSVTRPFGPSMLD